jgi:hypothetical protein
MPIYHLDGTRETLAGGREKRQQSPFWLPVDLLAEFGSTYNDLPLTSIPAQPEIVACSG